MTQGCHHSEDRSPWVVVVVVVMVEEDEKMERRCGMSDWRRARAEIRFLTPPSASLDIIKNPGMIIVVEFATEQMWM